MFFSDDAARSSFGPSPDDVFLRSPPPGTDELLGPRGEERTFLEIVRDSPLFPFSPLFFVATPPGILSLNWGRTRRLSCAWPVMGASAWS